MLKNRMRAALLLLVGVLTLSGLGGVHQVSAAADVPVGPIKWGACPDVGGAPRPAELQCAKITVPLDYRKPNGNKISVAVSRLAAANPSERRGVLLLNPGGPGGQGIDMPLWMSAIMPPEISKKYDLIGFDPRFVGLSTPVSCGLAFEDAMYVAPPLERQGGFDKTVQFMNSTAKACYKKSGWMLPHATTANTARDMDVIRRGLGVEKISYFGYSYGTYLGAAYAGLFPARTDRFILDSSTGPQGNWRETFRAWGQAGEVRFSDFAQFAVEHEAVFHLGKTEDQVRLTYFQLMEKLRKNPIDLGDPLLNDVWFRAITFSALYNDATLPALANFWQTVKEEPVATKLAPLVRDLAPADDPVKYPNIPEDNSAAAAVAVLCGDAFWSRNVDQYRWELKLDSQRHPMFGPLGSNIWPCAWWQNPSELPVAINGNGPVNKILILQNLRDPATPYWTGAEMRSALGRRARMVTVDQGGHGAAYIGFNACANNAATAYLTKGVYPSKDAYCAAESPVETFGSQGRDVAASKRDQAIRDLYRQMR
ncbi:MAG TPA: alpha/beta fold hydrolase [Candidatus Saccharimonadales bacterium]